jgi:hypothetical protein
MTQKSIRDFVRERFDHGMATRLEEVWYETRQAYPYKIVDRSYVLS